MNSKHATITLVLPLICILVFTFLLGTNLYVYFIYLLMGLTLYLFSRFFGRETSFLFIILILIFALEFTGSFFLLDIKNGNGLNPLKIHPFVFAWLIVWFLYFIEDIFKKRIILNRISILCYLVLMLFLGITFALRGTSGLSLVIHNYFGPISFFLFFYNNNKLNVKKINKAVNILLCISGLLGILGIVEYITEVNIFQDIYSSNSTWMPSQSVGGYRIKTIIGHPLSNAIFFLFSMVMVQIRVENIKLKYTLLFLFAIDILLTGSRSIFMLAFMVLIYNKHIISGGLKTAKQYILTVGVLGITVLLTLNTSLGSTFINRTASAGDSTETRYMLIDYFLKHLSSFHLLGLGGASENIKIIGRYNTPIIFEIPWITLFFEVGYFVLLYILMIVLIVRRIKYKFLVVIFIVALSGYASFGVRSNVNFLLFYLLTYCYVLVRAEDTVNSHKVNFSRKQIRLNSTSNKQYLIK